MIRRHRENSLAEVGWKEADKFQYRDATLLILEPISTQSQLLSLRGKEGKL